MSLLKNMRNVLQNTAFLVLAKGPHVCPYGSFIARPDLAGDRDCIAHLRIGGLCVVHCALRILLFVHRHVPLFPLGRCALGNWAVAFLFAFAS